MAMQYARTAAAAAASGLKGGTRLAELWALFDKLTPEQRARAQAWLADARRARSLEARIERTVHLADELLPGAQSVEEKEACTRYADRARSLAQAVAIAAEQRGRERLRQRARVKESTGELQAEMIAFLLQRGTVAVE
jgi:hypothetical protein